MSGTEIHVNVGDVVGVVVVVVVTRSSATVKSTARPLCLVGVLDIYRETVNRSTANQPLLCNWPRKATKFRKYNAELWPLRHSRSFKVTDFGTNQKPIYDFLLVINTNLSPILHHFQVIAEYMSYFCYRQSRCTLMPPLGRFPANIRINITSPESGGIVLPHAETARSYLHSSGHNTGE